MTEILKPTAIVLEKACTILNQGDLVGIPTETVYGLAADATQDLAVAKIFVAKGRPIFNPLIIHVADVTQARELVVFNALAEKLAAAFWPGPLTLVLKKKSPAISDLVGTGMDTLAIRIPAHPAAQALLQQFGKPIAAPSANPSNTLSPTCAEDVLALGEVVPLILDAGPTTVGLESTIVDLSTVTPTLLRPGGIAVEAIEAIVGPLTRLNADTPIKAPGMLKRHYAPQTPLRLNVRQKLPSEVMLGFGDIGGDLNLSPTGDLTEAAANLFRYLRQLDNQNATAIAVAPIPRNDLGLAINDRLQRAATENS